MSAPTTTLTIPEALQLAIAHHQSGHLQEAETVYREILKVQPENPDALHLLGLALFQSGKVDAAGELVLHSIRVSPGSPVSYNSLGNIRRAQGKLAEAAEHYEHALALSPEYAEAHYNLGIAQKELGRLDAAAGSFRRALELNPSFVQALCNLGVVLKDMGEVEEAIACYRRAIEINPSVATVFNHLGNALRDLGKLEEARAAFRQAIALQENYIAPYLNLARCWRFGDTDTSFVERLEELLQSGKLNPDDASDANFALGKIYDDLGRYEAAFRHFSEGNRIQTERSPRFDRAKHREMVSRQIAACTSEFFRSHSHLGNDSELPVLIVGMPRSGTTLVEQILSSHHAVQGGGELPFWAGQETHLPGGEWPPTPERAADIAKAYLAQLHGLAPGATRVTDKTPSNFLRLGLAHLLFPRARIIHCKRHPIDTCLSIYFTKFRAPHPYARDLEDLAFFYREYERIMAHWRGVLPEGILLEVQYEDLVEQQETVTGKMLDFCGLEWDDACLHFHENPRVVSTASSWQVRQPLYKTSAARWKHYEPFLGPLAGLLQPQGSASE
jgi:tetratricopeptide (TPR) repeat protein